MNANSLKKLLVGILAVGTLISSCKKDDNDTIEEKIAEGTVVLNTQAEVDAFSKNNTSIIQGNLVLGGGAVAATDSIRDISGLASIKEIRYNLVINNSFAGKTLTGLKSLQRLGGFRLGGYDISNDNATNNISTAPGLTIIELPEMSTVSTDLVINSKVVKDVKFAKLSNVGGSFIVRTESLTNTNFSALESVEGDLYIMSTATTVNKTLESLKFTALKKCVGVIKINNMFSLTDIQFPLLTSLGSIIMSSNSSFTAFAMPALEKLWGNMDFGSNAALTSVAFSKLKSANDIKIVGNSKITSLSFPVLTDVKVNMNIQNMLISDVSAFPALANVGGLLTVSSCANLTSIAGFSALKNVNQLVLSTLPAFTQKNLNLSTLESGGVNIGIGIITTLVMENVKGNMTLSGTIAAPIPDITAVKTVTGTVNLSSSNLSTVSLPNLSSVGGNLELQFEKSSSFNMPQLKTITGILKITGQNDYSNNTALINLSSFSSLTAVGGVTLTNLKLLSSTLAIKNAVATLADAKWIMTGCATNITLAQAKAGWGL